VKSPSTLTVLCLAAALIGIGVWVGTQVSMLPIDASSNAPVYDELFRVLFSIGTSLFVGICGLLGYSLLRFRRRAGDLGDGLAIEENLPLEIIWTAIPAVVVLFIGIYSYDIYERMGGMTPLMDHSAMHAAMVAEAPTSGPSDAIDSGSDDKTAGTVISGVSTAAPTPPKERIWGGIGIANQPVEALTVEVTAMQFAFIFNYPDSKIISGELHVPVNRPVELRMKANDVIHAFWVPQFRLKQDIIPGQPTLLSFTPTRAGTYPIICAELCGPYHGGMRSSVVVHEAPEFEQWQQQQTPV